MPAYNSEATIAAAIGSVRSQTIADWELIVVDDGSTDRTLEVAGRVSKGDVRIHVVSAPHGGRGEARNRCLAHARGSLIAICDSDDISLPQRFEREVQYLEHHPGVDVVSCSRVICATQDPTQAFAVVAPSTDIAIRRMFDSGRMPILFATAMVRSDVFRQCGTFDSELQRNQDYGFLLRACQVLRFGTIAESLILYRTTRPIADQVVVAENNFFRYCANRRALGDLRSACEIGATLKGRTYRALVIPLQYAWYLVSRRVFRRDIETLTAEEARQLPAAYADTNLPVLTPFRK